MSRLITVIVPVYNVEKYLDRCIESVVNQTYTNLEIILVDDGSPDKCPEMCDKWASKDKRITVIHKENGGLSDARNCAIKKVRGEYFLLVDSDDYIVEDAIEKLEAYAEDMDIVIGEDTTYKGEHIYHGIHTNLIDNYVYSGAEYSQKAIAAGEWYAGPCHNLYRTNFIIENKLFFKVGIFHEDIEYAPRLFLMAKKVKYLHYEFYKYMQRTDSICGKKTKKNLIDLFQIYSEWKKLNDTIQDFNLKKAYDGALSKYFIFTCKEYNISENVFPEGINRMYLVKNALNIKEFLKSILFICFRRLYVRL